MYNWSSPDGKTQNQTGHILIDRRWHSNFLDVRSFSETDCDIENYVVVANVRARLTVSMQLTQKFDIRRFSFRKRNELETGPSSRAV